MKLKKVITLGLFFLAIFNIISCSPGDITVSEPGFFAGLWHGFKIFYSLIGSIFDSSISLLAESNTGFTYYLGYIIGIIIAIPVELISLFFLFSLLFGKN